MAFTDRSPVATRPAAPAGLAKELFAGVLLLTLTTALALRALLSLDALAPVLATLLFAAAAVVAAIAMLCRRDGARHTCFDVAGVLTFIGVAITLLIEADQMIRLVSISEQPE